MHWAVCNNDCLIGGLDIKRTCIFFSSPSTLLADIMVQCGLAPASVRQVNYPWNYCAYLVLSLRVGCSGRCVQIIFEFRKKYSFFFMQLCLTWDPMGPWVKISKRYSNSFFKLFFLPNFCYRLLIVVPNKMLFWKFEVWSSLRVINDLISISSKTAIIVEWNGRKFGPRGCIY